MRVRLSLQAEQCTRKLQRIADELIDAARNTLADKRAADALRFAVVGQWTGDQRVGPRRGIADDVARLQSSKLAAVALAHQGPAQTQGID